MKLKKKLTTIKKKLEEIQREADLTRKFPGYFTKPIFQGVIIAMLLFTLFIYIGEHGQLTFIYAECPKDSLTSCDNPFYICPISNNDYGAYNPVINNCMPKDQIPDKIKPLCDAGLCENKSLYPGEVIGYKPGFLVMNYNTICLIMVLFAFLINDIKYRWLKNGRNNQSIKR